MRVLVADDEPIERKVVIKKLHSFFGNQIEIEEAMNGREAIEVFEKNPYQIALLDIEMPGINGLEAAAKIRETGKECQIIFLTAYDEFTYAKKAISVRALEYMLKPVAENELYACMEEAIRLAEMAAESGMAGNSESEKKIPETDVTGKSTADKDAVGKSTANKDVAGKNVADKNAEDESLDNIKMRKIAQMLRVYIEEHYTEDISLQNVAEYFKYSEAYFCKIFKQCFDKGFIVYLTELRVEKAKKLLEDIAVNVKDVSLQVGYRDSNYFAKVFKRIVGMTPSEYRNELLEKE